MMMVKVVICASNVEALTNGIAINTEKFYYFAFYVIKHINRFVSTGYLA